MPQGCIWVAPAHHEGTVPLTDGITHQRVFWLQIQDVVLVDARRHQHKRPLVHLGRQWLVFNQLENLVFIHHRTFRRGDVLAHFKHALVSHGDMPLLHVMQQVLNAFGQTLTLGFNRFLLGFRIQCQEVAWRHGSHPLLHGKTNALTRFLIGLHRLRHAGQGFGIEQIAGSRQRCHRVLLPRLAAKTLVMQLCRSSQTIRPQTRCFLHIGLLQSLQLLRIKLQCSSSRGRSFLPSGWKSMQGF